MVSRIVNGTPSAVVVDVPKLDRMSDRTTPLWVRMSGPFDPSPGNGPAVSSGMGVQSAPVAAAAELEDGFAVSSADAAGEHAASETSPTPSPTVPMTFRAWRRSMSVSTSKASPWSNTGSSGWWSGRPSKIGDESIAGCGADGGGLVGTISPRYWGCNAVDRREPS